MVSMLIVWVILTIAILVVAWLLPGVKVNSIGSAAFTAAILGFLNAFIKPIIVFLTIPITIVTLGLFLLVINALMFMLAGALVSGVQVKSFWWALLGSIIVSVVSWSLTTMLL